jgi:serine phosphatase RsbU (regulator of sigma subunit)
LLFLYNLSLSRKTKLVPEQKILAAFYKSTERFHVLACWIGIFLNLFWSIGDYFTFREMWVPFLAFRLGVCLVCLICLVLKSKINLSIYTCMFIFILGISIQNAYMWSVMDVSHFQKHTFAFMALFICAGMLVLWEFKYSLVLVFATIAALIIFYKLNSKLTIEDYLINGGLLIVCVSIASIFMIRQRYRLTYNEIKSRIELEESKNIIEIQKQEVEEKNIEITSSLRYAKRLQQAILPTSQTLNDFFADRYFVFYLPTDIVSGDFYCTKKIITTPSDGNRKEFIVMAVADCTGHGVPGAFMSLLGSNFLNQTTSEKDVNSPAEALDFLNRNIINTLKSDGNDQIRDGMDISLVAIDTTTNLMAYAGANNPILIIRNGSAVVLKTDKQAIGNVGEVFNSFTHNTYQLLPNDCVYLFTDGYPDQFGGESGKRFMKKKFENLLITLQNKTMEEQRIAVEMAFHQWKGEQPQTDDVCVVGIKI